MNEGAKDDPLTDAGDDPRSAEEIRVEIEQTREQLGETVEALAEKADVKARAHDRIEAARTAVAHNLGAARETVSGKTDAAVSRARETTPQSSGVGVQEVASTVQRKPLPFAAAGAFVAGVIVGRLLGRR
jgi:ElaB/YqjD/DUF883 family membrane-anchored ribosome-binding protein